LSFRLLRTVPCKGRIDSVRPKLTVYRCRDLCRRILVSGPKGKDSRRP
jgi:hypothetical protein